MHLFDIKRQKLHSKLPVSENPNWMFGLIDQELIEMRKQRWIDFFDENRNGSIGFYNHTVEALENVFSINEIILLQTEFQLLLSFEFYKKLFSCKNQLFFRSVIAGQKFLVLSLIFSIYPSAFLRSIESFFLNLEDEILDTDIDTLFCQLLVKYEMPEFIIQNFHFLTSDEIDIVIGALNGTNFRKHELFPVPPTKKEFSQLMALECHEFKASDSILIRGLIVVKLINVGLDEDDARTFVRASKTFQSQPYKYIRDIDFWKRAAQLSLMNPEHVHFNLTDVIDYLEYMRYDSGEQYSLRGRTTLSLFRSVEIWHGRVFLESHDFLRKMKWKGLVTESDLTFEFNNNTYQCIQLKSGELLYQEGNALQHCVITYAQSCHDSQCTIWSMQIEKKNEFKRLLTLEVIDKIIVQARKKHNSLPVDDEMGLVHEWAKRMDYIVELYKNA